MLITVACQILKSGVRSASRSASQVRVRFAPSPTGLLHVGGLRSALLNYLFALAHEGTFVLRLEDTDRTRYVAGSVEAMLETLERTGIKIDEGPGCGGTYGPYVQSERLHIYQQHADRLLAEDHAYRCFCSQERLSLLKLHSQSGDGSVKRGYDRKCLRLSDSEVESHLAAGTPFSIRFKMDDLSEQIDDLVYGRYVHNVEQMESDPIILKSDGYPTYHLANVVDDHLMRISHVIRGEEWMTSTPKHMKLYRAFRFDPPAFAHVPNLLGADGQKISKRHRDSGYGVADLLDQGVEGVVLCNYLARLGLRGQRLAETGSEIFELPDLAKDFELADFARHRYKVIPDDIFRLNQTCLASLPIEDLISRVRCMAEERGYSLDSCSIDSLKKLVHVMIKDKRMSSLKHLFDEEYLFFWRRPSIEPGRSELLKTFPNFDQFSKQDFFMENLRKFVSDAMITDSVGSDSVKTASTDFASSVSDVSTLKPAKFLKFVRLSLTGMNKGPKLREILDILGPDEAYARLQQQFQPEDIQDKSKTYIAK